MEIILQPMAHWIVAHWIVRAGEADVRRAHKTLLRAGAHAVDK